MPSTLLLKFLALILGLLCVDVAAQNFCWRDWTPGEIPQDALQTAGRYIGQANNNGNAVATIIPELGMAVFDMGGRHNATTNVKILITSEPNRFFWEQVNFNQPHPTVMENAVKGGFQIEEPNSDLYIGIVFHENEWKIGKVVPLGTQHHGIWVWNQAGQGVTVSPFFLLKYT